MLGQPPAWRKSTHCGPNTCVEVARIAAQVAVRDAKQPHPGPMIRVSPAAWRTLLAWIKDDEPA